MSRQSLKKTLLVSLRDVKFESVCDTGSVADLRQQMALLTWLQIFLETLHHFGRLSFFTKQRKDVVSDLITIDIASIIIVNLEESQAVEP